MYMSIWLKVGRLPELPGVNETVAVPLLSEAVTFDGDVGFEVKITGAIACGTPAPNGEKVDVTPQTWPLACVVVMSSHTPPV